MNKLKWALAAAEKGFWVFRVTPNKKSPPWVTGWQDEATRDPEKIKKLWSKNPEFNIGIYTGKFNENEALIVVDVDDKGEKHGSERIVELEIQGKELADTFTSVTPSGGKHLIYRSPVAVKQGESVLAHGLDIRSRGGFIVGPGSTIDGKAYAPQDTTRAFHIAQAAQWVIDKCEEQKTHAVTEAAENISQEGATARAEAYLKNDAPLAIEGQGGDYTTFKVAAKVKDYGVGQAEAVRLMLLYWNGRCVPPWNGDDLEIKVHNAYKHGQNAVGALAPENYFSVIPEDAPATKKPEKKNYLEEINETYAIVYMEGSHFILHETIDEKGRKRRVFFTEQTFKRRFAPQRVQKGRSSDQSFADAWLEWSGARSYQGVCFAPEREVRNNYYNLWRGFVCGTKPPEAGTAEQREGLRVFLEHALQNVCANDESLFTWLMGYFAHMIQKPYERPLTTVVFKGEKGVGKNAIVDRIGNLLGSGHYLVAYDGRYLTSNFNGHLDSCLCLVLDEAFWSGDKTADGKLKGLTTAPEIMIERKGKEPYQVDNLARIVILGNEDWLVPATADERRYAVFNVGTGKKQNREYFKRMKVLLEEKGGNQLLLHYFKTFDLSKVDVNHAPQTEGLLEQKVAGLEPFPKWWFECLSQGKIVGVEFENDWSTDVDKSAFRIGFRNYCKESQIRSRIPGDREIGMLLSRLAPSTLKDKKRRDGERTFNIYRLPDLKAARHEWNKYMGQEIKWDQ